MTYVNNVKENADFISDIERTMGNRKLKAEELQFLLKTLEDFKKKKKYSNSEENKQRQELHKFSGKYHLSPVKPSYDYQDEFHALRNNRKVKHKEVKLEKLDYPLSKRIKTNQVDPSKFYANSQTEMRMYPKFYQNLKDGGTFNEDRIISTKRDHFHQNVDHRKSAIKQLPETQKDLLKTTVKTTEEMDYPEIFSDQFSSKSNKHEKNKYQQTNNHTISNAFIMLFSSLAVISLIIIIFVLIRCTRKKKDSEKTPNIKKRRKKENKSTKYTLREDNRQKCSTSSSEDEFLNQENNKYDAEYGFGGKKTKTNMDAGQIPKINAFSTSHTERQNYKKKEPPTFISDNKTNHFRPLYQPKNNFKDKFSSSTDEPLSSLDASGPSMQDESIKYSNNSEFVNRVPLDKDNNLITFSSSLEEGESGIEASPCSKTADREPLQLSIEPSTQNPVTDSDSDSGNSYSSTVTTVPSNTSKVKDKNAFDLETLDRLDLSHCDKSPELQYKIKFILEPKGIHK